MSNKTTSKTADAAPAEDVKPVEADPRDAEIAELIRQRDAALAEAQEAAMHRRAAQPEDAKDKAIAALKAEVEQLRATPEGAAAEMQRALDALAAKVEQMASGRGLVPVGTSDEPDPLEYGAFLATGEVIYVQHPHATEHYSEEHGITVPITGFFTLDAATRERVNA